MTQAWVRQRKIERPIESTYSDSKSLANSIHEPFPDRTQHRAVKQIGQNATRNIHRARHFNHVNVARRSDIVKRRRNIRLRVLLLRGVDRVECVAVRGIENGLTDVLRFRNTSSRKVARDGRVRPNIVRILWEALRPFQNLINARLFARLMKSHQHPIPLLISNVFHELTFLFVSSLNSAVPCRSSIISALHTSAHFGEMPTACAIDSVRVDPFGTSSMKSRSASRLRSSEICDSTRS